MIHRSNIDLQRLARRLRRATARCGCRTMTGTNVGCKARSLPLADKVDLVDSDDVWAPDYAPWRAVATMQGTRPRRLDCPRCRTLLRRRRHSLQHVGDAVVLISTLQAPTLLVPRARVRLGSSEGDCME